MKYRIIYTAIFVFSLSCLLYINRYSGRESNSEIFYETPSYPADDWFERQRAFPFNEIPEEERLKSIEYVKHNMQVSDFNGMSNWVLAGPTNIEGRITVLAIHPTNPQIVYAAFPCGSDRSCRQQGFP